MSKDSSIKVFAENASGTRPANAIPVWIDNISAIGGGGGGGNPEVESYVTTNSGKIDNICSAVEANSASWDVFYIYPGQTTDKEISENSGKDMKLYNSANNVYLDYAGKVTYSNYSIFNFKGVTGLNGNYNTLQHLKLLVYPNATSACKVYQTTSVNLLDSNSNVQYAETASYASYDSNSNSLAQTHDTLTALNQFVQTNSANWGGGGGSTGASIPLRITYSVSDEYGNKYTNYYLSSDGSPFVFTAYDEGYQPADLMINGNNYSWSYNNGRWEILHSINGQENVDAFYNAGLEYSGKNIIHFYADNITPELNKVVVNTTNGSITGEIILYDQYNMTYFSSFTGSWSSYIPTSYNGNTITSYGLNAGSEYEGNDFGYTIDVYQEANGGSTINSADIFPSTDNLNPGSRYILAWNTNNGGLYWGT